MATADSGLARFAIDELRAHGCLQDGTLREVSFPRPI